MTRQNHTPSVQVHNQKAHLHEEGNGKPSTAHPSWSAEACAYLRSYFNVQPKDHPLHFDDPYAHLFVDKPHAWIIYGLRKLSVTGGFLRATSYLYDGLLEHLLVRFKVGDETFGAHINSHSSPQVVIVGSGYDTRTLRFHKDIISRGATVYEIDTRETLSNKITILSNEFNCRVGDDAFEQLPPTTTTLTTTTPTTTTTTITTTTTTAVPHVGPLISTSTVEQLFEHHWRFVPLDVDGGVSAAELLLAKGLSPQRPTLVMVEGISMYLPSSTVSTILKTFSMMLSDPTHSDAIRAPSTTGSSPHLHARIRSHATPRTDHGPTHAASVDNGDGDAPAHHLFMDFVCPCMLNRTCGSKRSWLVSLNHRVQGEPLTFGLDEDATVVGEFFAREGWSNTEIISREILERRYLTDQDGTLVASLPSWAFFVRSSLSPRESGHLGTV
eukprot:TRINITY_DN8629_c0_g1_i1.p1 TRINITY_DN8629_c0_g1~~TRINITY_DN8629_c0_g1_i1.p1  ORF type:complete len:476 (-),score=44.50 TRINITY_DN8629_c0_g1_i1:88-1410(-)